MEELARTAETRGFRPAGKASAEALERFYDYYAKVFYDRISRAFGEKLLGEGLDGLTMEHARRIAPHKAQAGEVLQKVMEERLYDSGPNIMQHEKYWEILRKTYAEMAEHISRQGHRTVSSLMREEVMRTGLSQLVLRAERARLWKMLEKEGLENAWARFREIIGAAAKIHGIPMNEAALSAKFRKVALGSRDHRDFFLRVLGVSDATDPSIRKQLLVDLDMSDISYNPQGRGNKLLKPKERALLNMSLESGIVPEKAGGFFSGEDRVFGKFVYNSFREDILELSMGRVREMVVINEKIEGVMRRVFGFPGKAASPEVQAKPAAEPVRAARPRVPVKAAPEPTPRARARRVRGVGAMAAAQLALGALAYYLITNPDKVSWALGKAGTLVPVPRRDDGVEAALWIVAPSPSGRETRGRIKKMLGSLKVRGKKLTRGQKLHALRIAAERKGVYAGKDMEQFVKIAAILQFIPKQGDAAVAMLSEEIKELVPPREQEAVSKELLEKYSRGAPRLPFKKRMVKEFREELERLREELK